MGSVYEIGYEDGYQGREWLTQEKLEKQLHELGFPAIVSPADVFEYNRGYRDGELDAGKDWTA